MIAMIGYNLLRHRSNVALKSDKTNTVVDLRRSIVAQTPNTGCHKNG